MGSHARAAICGFLGRYTIHMKKEREREKMRKSSTLIASLRLAIVGVTSTVTSSPTHQICLCGNEVMKREVVLVT